MLLTERCVLHAALPVPVHSDDYCTVLLTERCVLLVVLPVPVHSDDYCIVLLTERCVLHAALPVPFHGLIIVCIVLLTERCVLHAALLVPVRSYDELGVCVRLHHRTPSPLRRGCQETLHCSRSVRKVNRFVGQVS